MCQFLSAVILKNGDVRWHPMLDSHSDLVRVFKLPDTNAHIRHFAKVELTPVDWTDASTWTWRIDEPTRPDWLDEVEAEAERQLRAIAQRMIVTSGEVDLIADGCWIFAGTAKLREIKSGRIVRLYGSAQVREMFGSAQVGTMFDSAQVREMYGSAQVGTMFDSAQVGAMSHSAQVGTMFDSAQVGTMSDSAQVREMFGSAQVGTMSHSAQVGRMSHSAQVGAMFDSARIVNDRRVKP